MFVQINDPKKMVLIWLSHQDQADAQTKEKINRISKTYSNKKYIVGVFLSGQEDLLQQTSGLLCHNLQAAEDVHR